MLAFSSDGSRCSPERCQIHQPQYHQHQSDREFHAQADARRNHYAKENDGTAHHEDGESVSYAPECPGQGSTAKLALPGHDGSHGDHMIGIRGMAHAKKEADGNNGEKWDH